VSALRKEISALDRYQRALDMSTSGAGLHFDSACGPAAEKYIRAIRNKAKQEYAWAYWRWMNRLGVGEEPAHPTCRGMAAQGVRLHLQDICGIQYAPDEYDLRRLKAQADDETRGGPSEEPLPGLPRWRHGATPESNPSVGDIAPSAIKHAWLAEGWGRVGAADDSSDGPLYQQRGKRGHWFRLPDRDAQVIRTRQALWGQSARP